MATEDFEIGADVFCGGTICGCLAAVAITSASSRLAHLIVDPVRGGQPRLVWAALAHATENGISLNCTLEQFGAMKPAVVAHVEPDEAGADLDEERRWGRHGEVSSWPAFGLGPTLNPSFGTPAPPPIPRPHVEFE